MSDQALIVFVKNTEWGKVKTRIASSVGPGEALRIYERLLQYTRDVVRPLSCNKYVFYSNFIEPNDIWDNSEFTKEVQKGEDLGACMANAFRYVLAKHTYAVIVGSDCGELKTGHIRSAFDALRDSPVVLGPTYDGGYYLLGLSQFIPGIFGNIQWSTEQVFRDTVRFIERISLKYSVLDTLHDVDYYEDWQKLEWSD